MTRAISHFSGTNNNTIGGQTIHYTCPAGRTAKVILTYVTTTDPTYSALIIAGQNAVRAISVDGTNATTAQLGGVIPAVTSLTSAVAVLTPGENQTVGWIGSFTSGRPALFTSVWYLGPGQTVGSTANGNNSASTTYDFTVIEEY